MSLFDKIYPVSPCTLCYIYQFYKLGGVDRKRSTPKERRKMRECLYFGFDKTVIAVGAFVYHSDLARLIVLEHKELVLK